MNIWMNMHVSVALCHQESLLEPARHSVLYTYMRSHYSDTDATARTRHENAPHDCSMYL